MGRPSPDEVFTGAAESEVLFGTNANDLIEGFFGHDYLNGLWGHDVIYGGAAGKPMEGDDLIDSADKAGAPDTVECGEGDNDVVHAGVEDFVADDCETIFRYLGF